jgi:hypothetical protein
MIVHANQSVGQEVLSAFSDELIRKNLPAQIGFVALLYGNAVKCFLS